MTNEIASCQQALPERTTNGRWVMKCDPEQISELVVNQGKSMRETARLLGQPFSTVQGISQRRGWKRGHGSLPQVELHLSGNDPRMVTAETVVKPEVLQLVQRLRTSPDDKQRSMAAYDLYFEVVRGCCHDACHVGAN